MYTHRYDLYAGEHVVKHTRIFFGLLVGICRIAPLVCVPVTTGLLRNYWLFGTRAASKLERKFYRC